LQGLNGNFWHRQGSRLALIISTTQTLYIAAYHYQSTSKAVLTCFLSFTCAASICYFPTTPPPIIITRFPMFLYNSANQALKWSFPGVSLYTCSHVQSLYLPIHDLE